MDDSRGDQGADLLARVERSGSGHRAPQRDDGQGQRAQNQRRQLRGVGDPAADPHHDRLLCHVARERCRCATGEDMSLMCTARLMCRSNNNHNSDNLSQKLELATRIEQQTTGDITCTQGNSVLIVAIEYLRRIRLQAVQLTAQVIEFATYVRTCYVWAIGASQQVTVWLSTDIQLSLFRQISIARHEPYIIFKARVEEWLRRLDIALRHAVDLLVNFRMQHQMSSL